MKENSFIGSVMESDVLRIARGVSNDLLLFGGPGDNTASEGVAMTADGAAGVGAISIVRVGIANKRGRVVGAQG